jgi:hypothetical protein
MRLVYAALVVLLASYAPLLAIGFMDPSANPIGLGLLAVAGTAAAVLLIVCAALRAIWRAWR